MALMRVRIYCEDCSMYHFTEQEVIDELWKPDGCADHSVRDFVIVGVVEVE